MKRRISGGTDVWVTFEETTVLEGFPPRNDDDPYPARAAWLEANPIYIRGTAYPNPDYDNFANFPQNHDIGIVVLDEPAPVSTFGVLAPLGTADALAAIPRDRNNALVETVGYGTQSVQPQPMDVASRFKSTSRIVEVAGNQSVGGNLHTLNNPSEPGGVGGSCWGARSTRSWSTTANQVVAVVSYGPSLTCHGAD